MADIKKISINGVEHIIVDSALTENFNTVVTPSLSGTTVQGAIDATITENNKNYYTKGTVDELINGVDVSAQLVAYPDAAVYDSVNKEIKFSHSGTVLPEMTIDATAFIKDGMVDNVEVKDGKLVITFNTDSGKEAIEIGIEKIFNAENYYTKTEVNAELAKKADAETTYSKEEVDGLLGEKVDKSTYATDKDTFETKSHADDTFLKKTDAATTYLTKEEAEGTYATKTEVETDIAAAVDGLASEEYVDGVLEEYYTKTEVDEKLTGITETLEEIEGTLTDIGDVLDADSLSGETVQAAIEETVADKLKGYATETWVKTNIKMEVADNTLVINLFNTNG